MRMANKMTKVEMFTMIMGMVENEEVQAFCSHEIELLQRKGKSENSKKVAEQEKVLSVVLESLESMGKPVTVTELLKASAELSEFSNQKVSAYLKKLVESGKVVKTVEKKVSYFSIAE